jgi:hypothetical protein
MRGLAGSAALVNRLLLGGRARLPGILIPSRLHARCKPMRFDNSRLKRTLEWAPRYTWRQGVERSLGLVAPDAATATEPALGKATVPA